MEAADHSPSESTISVCTVLADLLSDKRRPADGFCVLCFTCVPRLLDFDGPEIVPLRKMHHKLWDACMRNLTVPRTSGETVALRQLLQDNINNRKWRSSDRPHQDVSVDWENHVSGHLELFYLVLGLCLSNCLYGPDVPTGNTGTVVQRASYPRKRFRSGSGAWPSRTDQLFPYGPDRTVDALIEACCNFADCSAFWVLRAVLRLARPLAWEAPLRQENHHRIACYIAAMLVLPISASPLHLEIISRLASQGCNVPPAVLDCEWLRTTDPRNAAFGFLETVTEWPYAHSDDAARFVEVPDVRTGIIHAFMLASDHYQCGRTMLESAEDRLLAPCARCRLPRYCSKESQRENWRAEHRRLVPALRTALGSSHDGHYERRVLPAAECPHRQREVISALIRQPSLKAASLFYARSINTQTVLPSGVFAILRNDVRLNVGTGTDGGTVEALDPPATRRWFTIPPDIAMSLKDAALQSLALSWDLCEGLLQSMVVRLRIAH
ncbi:hypothetical protein AURDEDRAFT_129630 [Auricularia subglabra TFB-10046 SS5]|nr:hypothetical protein AURDEDRAFT_129630 [Auricularia subglabra TFB-10046 SS5]